MKNENDLLAFRLKEMGEYLSYAKIAEKYFGKSRSWMAHKINNDLVNGKPAAFNVQELERMAEIFRELAGRLKDLADDLDGNGKK